MAFIQFLKRILVVAALVICFDGVQGCHPTSKALHICLNIYLEKDFPLIETFVKSRRQGRVLLEDPDLQNICRHIASLHDCYNSLWRECTSYWQVERFSRLVHLIGSTHSYLCSNTTDVLKVLLNTDCMSRAKAYIDNCSNTGFDWMVTWKQILRMQVSPEDRCHALGNYKTCLARQLMGIPCGMESTRVYGNLIDVWLKNWCDKDSSPSSSMKYFYHPLTFT
ncbi:unnamed protein product [Larinioides sclopetarius]|uniref:Uncharacterized protein n=1 Tax=Larinioides sclopetarius TaxID=280406 RepID=A0AAV2AXE8_9ARAC